MELQNIINGADYLHIEELLDEGCDYIAQLIIEAKDIKKIL